MPPPMKTLRSQGNSGNLKMLKPNTGYPSSPVKPTAILWDYPWLATAAGVVYPLLITVNDSMMWLVNGK